MIGRWAPTAMVVAFLALFALGCETTTISKQVDARHFIVCDGTGDDIAKGHCDGSNPEKGLLDTCPSIGRTIVTYAQIQENGLFVTCGPLVRTHG